MKMIFGGIYKRTHNKFNEQSYGYYIPVAYKDKTTGNIRYRMVDTYMVRNPCWGDESMKKRLWYLEQANCGETSWSIFFGADNYYYRNIVTLPNNELDENEWELVADLHDYEIVNDDDSNDYLSKDLLMYVPLWNEDSYRRRGYGVGRIYLKKGAKKDGWKVYAHATATYDFGMTSDYKLNSLETICKDVLKNMALARGKKRVIKDTLRRIRKYRKLSKEYYEFCKQLKD